MILSVDNEAAIAALTKGVTLSKAALLSVYLFWVLATQYHVAIWAERAPTRVNPADAPSREGQLFSDAGLKEDMAPFTELFAICDLLWVLPQRTA